MEEITIHECQVKDLDDSLKDLWRNLAQEMFQIERITVPSEGNSNKWYDFVKDGISKRRNLLLVAKTEKRTVGIVQATLPRETALEVQEPFAIINDLYVLPEFRGKGIGKKLLERCLSRIRTERFKAARIYVLQGDEDAIKLYKKLGFRVFMHSMTIKLT
jgi:ribosomal protein S18 acetylase RimI-like enzyme